MYVSRPLPTVQRPPRACRFVLTPGLPLGSSSGSPTSTSTGVQNRRSRSPSGAGARVMAGIEPSMRIRYPNKFLEGGR